MSEKEVRAHEVPQDDVPGEYLIKSMSGKLVGEKSRCQSLTPQPLNECYWQCSPVAEFDSEADVEKLRREYQHNTKLLGTLGDITRQKVPLKHLECTDEFVNYRPDLSRGDP